jgi:hypothetical protein
MGKTETLTWRVGLGGGLWCLMPLSTIFQLYRGDGALETIIGFTFFRAVVVLLDVETIETLFPVTFCMPLALFDPEFFCICVLGLPYKITNLR